MNVWTFALCLCLSLSISSVRSLSCFSSNDCADGFVCDEKRSCLAPPISTTADFLSAANFMDTGKKSAGIYEIHHAHKNTDRLSNGLNNIFESGCLATMIRRDKVEGNPERFPEGSAFRHYLRNIYDHDGHDRRTCNSDDGVISSQIMTRGAGLRKKNDEEGRISSSERIKKEHCDESKFKYEEVRIAAGNWESSIVVSRPTHIP